MKYIIAKKDESLGCCNMIIWDMLIIILQTVIIGYYNFHIHVVFCIIIGIIFSVILFALMNIKYIGTILQIVCGIFWAFLIWSILDEIIHIGNIQDPIWDWTIKIILGLICIGLHFASTSEMIEAEGTESIDLDGRIPNLTLGNHGISVNLDDEFSNVVKRFENAGETRMKVMSEADKLGESHNMDSELYRVFKENDKIWVSGTSNIEMLYDLLFKATSENEARKLLNKMHNLLSEMEQANYDVMKETEKIKSTIPDTDPHSNIDKSLFAGCTSKASITKRYKTLMKTFHPDINDGDTEMTVKIQRTYEELLKKYF